MYIYEKAFKESIALCLNIEQQWLLIQEILQKKELTQVSALSALDRLIHLMGVLERSDTKVKLLQELANCEEKILSLAPAFDDGETTTTKLKSQCYDVSRSLTVSSRILARQLMNDVFLARFYYRQENVYESMHAKVWANQSSDEIRGQVCYWLKHLENVWEAIEMILWVVRSTGNFEKVQVQSGFHRENIKNDMMKISLVRINRERLQILPSLTMAQHWLVVTMYETFWDGESYQSKQLEKPTEVLLSLCR